ncbi:MAG: hypothetical protein Q9180_007853 [Flavoplaca navasiana]
METEVTLEALLNDADFRSALPHFVLKHLSILDQPSDTLVAEPDNSRFILNTMAAELDIVIKYWEPVSLLAVLEKRIAAIQPMIADVDDYNEQAHHLLVKLLRLNIKFLQVVGGLRQMRYNIDCRRIELYNKMMVQ